jgi:hypothetical protein
VVTDFIGVTLSEFVDVSNGAALRLDHAQYPEPREHRRATAARAREAVMLRNF